MNLSRRVYLLIFSIILPLYVFMEFMKYPIQPRTRSEISKPQTVQLVVDEKYFILPNNLEDGNTNVDMKMSIPLEDMEYLFDRLKYPEGQHKSLLEVQPLMHNPHYCLSSAYHSPYDRDIQADLKTPRHGSFVPKSGWIPLEEGVSVIEKIDWVFYVHTSVKNIERRQAIRKTWGFPKLFKNYTMRLLFVVGRPEVPALQTKLDMEYSFYGDILQGDFLDTYKNLTYKAVFTLRWLKSYCSHVPMVLKADDDTFINIFHIKDYLIKYSSFKSITEDSSDLNSESARLLLTTPKPGSPVTVPSKTLICHLYANNTMPIMREKKTCLKWCVNKMDLPNLNYFPKYCSGLLYFFTMPLISRLYEQVKTTPFLWIDDVYVTGLLPAKVNSINYVNIKHDINLNGYEAFKRYNNQSEPITDHVVHVVDTEQFANLWNRLLRRLSDEQMKELTLSVDKLVLKETAL